MSFKYSDIDIFLIIVTIYPNDTCTIVIGCSSSPIPLDFEGVNRLSDALCRIEEKAKTALKQFINKYIRL
ncbi:MAG TPA: hypothetical protein VJ697_06755 [Nitrososphaeraceae archaeon]|nr:hypothetical protein [Nitrososphaeraceae archaeon]